MRRHPSCFVLLTSLLSLAVGPAPHAGDFEDTQVMHIDYPAWFKDSLLDFQEDIEEARGEGKLGLMVLFTTDGCSYCDVFIRRSLGDEQLATLTRSHFDAVGLEIFNDAEIVDPRGGPLTVKEFAKREGVAFSPTLLFYGADGRLLYRGVGYHSPERFRTVLDYLIEGHYLKASFRDYAAAREAGGASPPSGYRLHPDPLFASPPYALGRSRFPAERPLLAQDSVEGNAY